MTQGKTVSTDMDRIAQLFENSGINFEVLDRKDGHDGGLQIIVESNRRDFCLMFDFNDDGSIKDVYVEEQRCAS